MSGRRQNHQAKVSPSGRTESTSFGFGIKRIARFRCETGCRRGSPGPMSAWATLSLDSGIILVYNTNMTNAVLIRHEKFIVRRRYLVELTVHQVPKSDRYEHGFKWGMVCVDRISGKRVLMDNHHPKGPHVHIDDAEVGYECCGLDRLVDDFRRMVSQHMGVQI